MAPEAADDPTGWLRAMVPLAATLGFVALALEPGEVRLRLGWDMGLTTGGGTMHGGALMALADTSGAVCSYLNLPPDSTGTTTVESKTNFLRAVREDHAETLSRPLHVGRSMIVVETEIRDGDGRLAAKVTQSQIVLRATAGGP